MLLDFTWLIPGIPIISSVFIAFLLLSFTKTMNRLTKPVSYFLIISLAFSELLNFILFKKNISGNQLLFGSNFELIVDRSAILFSESIGAFFLLTMIFSFAKLQRRNGYVRYFIILGLLSGSLYLFSFSGSLFHGFYDPIMSYISTNLMSS
tara:strand:+ start:1201 stop:1653 length:453 start_codon:yes stop_codon:yes gene_type:complete